MRQRDRNAICYNVVMKEYQVFLREPHRPNVVRVTAASPSEARRLVESRGLRVRAVKPSRF